MNKDKGLIVLKRLAKIILVNGLILIILMSLAEGILQFYPVSDPYEQNKISTRHYFNPVKLPNKKFSFTIEDSLPGFKSYTKYPQITSNNLGFRNSEDIFNLDKGVNEYRVFAIGGSTTECAFLNDGDDWPSLLGDKLNTLDLHKTFQVINTGQSGHNLNDNLHLVIQKLIHLQPDLFILYVGVNELYPILAGQDLYKMDLKNAPKNSSSQLFLTETQLGRRLYYLLKGLNPNVYHITAQTRQKKLADELRRMPISDLPVNLGFQIAKNNLRALIGICNALDIKLIVATQAVSWDLNDYELDNWHTAQYGGKRYSETDLNQTMYALNRALEKLCLELKTPVIDVQNMIKPTAENFYDDFHFNKNGSKNMTDLLFNYLVENPSLIGTEIK